jgi:hypothetical protein
VPQAPPPPPPPPLRCFALLQQREAGGAPPAPLRAATFPQRWAESRARALTLAGWSPDNDASSDGALLPLALDAGDVLLTGAPSRVCLRHTRAG